MSDKNLLPVIVLGALANFPWEMAHSFLYRGVADFTLKQHLECCGLASLVDGAGIALISYAGARVFGEPRWTQRATPTKLLFTGLLGLVGAVLVERAALHLDWWAYGPQMPRLPGTRLGLSPLLQFVLLPLGVLFWALPRWQKSQRHSKAAG